MQVDLYKNNSYDRGYMIGASTLKKRFGLTQNDFDLAREFAVTFNVDNSLVTMKGTTLRRRGDAIRIGKKAIPEKILNKHDSNRHFTMDVVDVRKMTTIRT